MPLYEYQCNSCGEAFERFFGSHRRMDEPKNDPCPSCGEKRVDSKLNTGVNVGDPIRMGHRKPDRALRERFREIQQAHPLGNMKNQCD